MNAPYRKQNVATANELQPEDEMRLILFKADERALKGMLLRRVVMLVFATVCVISAGAGGVFWIALHAVALSWIGWDYTRRARLLKKLKSEGVDVPASLANRAAS